MRLTLKHMDQNLQVAEIDLMNRLLAVRERRAHIAEAQKFLISHPHLTSSEEGSEEQ